jgi:general secretion pathway protein G
VRRGLTIAAGVPAVALAAWVGYRTLASTEGSARERLALSQVRHLGGKVAQYLADTGRLPETLGELATTAGHGPYASAAELRDPWGRAYFYQRLDAPGEFTVFTLGSNGRLGGRGDETDHFFDSKSLREDGQ